MLFNLWKAFILLKGNLISNCCSVIDQIDVYEGNEEG